MFCFKQVTLRALTQTQTLIVAKISFAPSVKLHKYNRERADVNEVFRGER